MVTRSSIFPIVYAAFAASAVPGLLGCNVEATAEVSTGGVKKKEPQLTPKADDKDAGTDNPTPDAGTSDGGTSGETGEDEEKAPTQACPEGLTVVMSDYVSTQVALSSLEGQTLSSAFISTASSETKGLSFALSGDVTLPQGRIQSERVVLLDRFGTNVITWLDPQTAEVLNQLPVGTGFESNPYDYLELDDETALVARWGHNEAAGSEDYDTGGDLLVINTKTPAIIDSIPMPTADDLPARPAGLLRVGDEVWVNLNRVASDYSTTGTAQLVGIDAEKLSVTWEHSFEGLKACGLPVFSPDQTQLAMACSGQLSFDGTVEDPEQSVILLLDPTTTPPKELRRFKANDLAGEPLQDDVAYASERWLLFKTQTPYAGTTHNRLLALDLETEQVRELAEAAPAEDGSGQGISFHRIFCAPGCSRQCTMADSASGILQSITLEEDGPELGEPITVEDKVGLPPTGLASR